jgi:hypothetical protein
MSEHEPLRFRSIIGRERALIDALAKALNNMIGGPPNKRTLAELRRHNASRVWPTQSGCAFEVQIVGPDDDGPTGHIVRVTVELDRFEGVR